MTVQAVTLEAPLNQQILDNLAVAYQRTSTPSETALAVLREVMQCRRVAGRHSCTAAAPCAACTGSHLPKIAASIEKDCTHLVCVQSASAEWQSDDFLCYPRKENRRLTPDGIGGGQRASGGREAKSVLW